MTRDDDWCNDAVAERYLRRRGVELIDHETTVMRVNHHAAIVGALIYDYKSGAPASARR
jgi:hypothetical protein